MNRTPPDPHDRLPHYHASHSFLVQIGGYDHPLREMRVTWLLVQAYSQLAFTPKEQWDDE